MSFIKVKNNNHLVRNTESNCIINTNKSEYEQYISRRKLKQDEVSKVENLEKDGFFNENAFNAKIGMEKKFFHLGVKNDWRKMLNKKMLLKILRLI